MNHHGRIVARTPDGAPTLFVGTVTDITERTQAEMLRQEQERELHCRQAQRMELVGQLAGGVAHEFNNMLQVILGYGRLALAASPPQSDCHEDIQEVVSAAERAAALTQQLLSFSRRQQFRPRKVEPNAVVAEIAKMLQPIIGDYIEVAVDRRENLEAVWADPGELQQVLLNLCLNARDAMPSGGRLKVGADRCELTEPFPDPRYAAQPGAYVVFTVEDTGCGLSDEVRKRMFEPFFTTKEVGKGTGLGLSMVYNMIQDHQGAIRVKSEPGRGTSFEIYLPVAAAQNEPASGDDDALLEALAV